MSKEKLTQQKNTSDEEEEINHIKTWQVKKFYDCPRYLYFNLEFRRVPSKKTKAIWDQGNKYEDSTLQDFKGFRGGGLYYPYVPKGSDTTCFILEGHPDATRIMPNTIIGIEIKSYDCRTSVPYEQDLFQSEVYLFLLRYNFPHMTCKMVLEYANKDFAVNEYDKVRMKRMFAGVCEVVQHPNDLPKVHNKKRIRRPYLCSSAKCIYKVLCKEAGYD